MSSNSVVGKTFNNISSDIHSGIGALGSGDIAGAAKGFGSAFYDPFNVAGMFGRQKQTNPQGLPDAPNPADATNAALDAQLKNELNIRRSMALVTGGQGVTGQISTAGQSLMGA